MKAAGRIALALALLVAVNLLFFLPVSGKTESAGDSGAAPLPPPPPDRLILAFAGDLMAHSVNFMMADYGDIYREMKPAVEAADLAFINLETPVMDDADYASFPRFNVHTPYVEAAVEGGFDLFALANNHACDRESAGVSATYRTMEALRETSGIAFSGIRSHARAPMRSVRVDAGNWKVGFLSITSFVNVWEGNELVYLADYYRSDDMKRELLQFIESVRPLYDILVVGVHDGIEYEHDPLERKKLFFRELAEAGADVVWGHHSHVLQPWELHQRTQGGPAVLIYSMGNFISGQTWNIDPEDYDNDRNATGDSCLLYVAFTRPAGKSAAGIESVEPYFAFNYRDPVKGMVVRPLDTLAGDPEVPDVWKRYYLERKKRLEWFTVPAAAEEAAENQS